VIPPQAMPYGHSYGEWGAKYWQWLAAIPLAINPADDPTGANAGVGQSGKVWFLTTNYGWDDSVENHPVATVERTITIPVGKAVFVPLWTSWQVMPLNGSTEAELRYWDDWFTAHVASLQATLDGKQLGNLFSYRASSPSLFKLWWPDDNVLYMDPTEEPADATCEGFSLMLAPLFVGRHELHWKSIWVLTAAEGWFDFTVTRDITYHITVTPR
jgi:hypothetical protein